MHLKFVDETHLRISGDVIEQELEGVLKEQGRNLRSIDCEGVMLGERTVEIIRKFSPNLVCLNLSFTNAARKDLECALNGNPLNTLDLRGCDHLKKADLHDLFNLTLPANLYLTDTQSISWLFSFLIVSLFLWTNKNKV